MESKKKNPLVASYALVPSYEEKPPPQSGQSLKAGSAPQHGLGDKAPTCAPQAQAGAAQLHIESLGCLTVPGDLSTVPRAGAASLPRAPGKAPEIISAPRSRRRVPGYGWARAETARSVGLRTETLISELFCSCCTAEIIDDVRFSILNMKTLQPVSDSL